MNENGKEAYDRGYAQGIIQGRIEAGLLKEDAVKCRGCAFEAVESWEMPCMQCKRNCKDYWRAKAE